MSPVRSRRISSFLFTESRSLPPASLVQLLPKLAGLPRVGQDCEMLRWDRWKE